MEKKEEKIVIKVDSYLKELIPGYINNRYSDIETIKTALENGDYETIKILGHSMKGSGGGYGFDAITEIGKSIEQAAKEKDTDTIKSKLEALNDYLKRIEIVFI